MDLLLLTLAVFLGAAPAAFAGAFQDLQTQAGSAELPAAPAIGATVERAAPAPASAPAPDYSGSYAAAIDGFYYTYEAAIKLGPDGRASFSGAPSDFDARDAGWGKGHGMIAFDGEGTWTFASNALWLALKGRATGPDSQAFDGERATTLILEVGATTPERLRRGAKVHARCGLLGDGEWSLSVNHAERLLLEDRQINRVESAGAGYRLFTEAGEFAFSDRFPKMALLFNMYRCQAKDGLERWLSGCGKVPRRATLVFDGETRELSDVLAP